VGGRQIPPAGLRLLVVTVDPAVGLALTAVLLLAVPLLTVLAVVVVRQGRALASLTELTRRAGAGSQARATPRVAIVVNPTKVSDVGAMRARAAAVCDRHGWAEPLWLSTTAQDPGLGQARQALAAGVDLVCSLGGDGTVRQVAQALAGTGTPLGLLPGGTGNLLARNLGMSLTSVEAALAGALTGTDRSIDVGLVIFDGAGPGQSAVPGPDRGAEQVFLVMAGVGFDAAMVAGAPERLKARFGWLAYAASGMQHLQAPRPRARVVADGGPPVTRRVHSVLVGNCGTLTGGIVLLPDARVDDGWLDAVTLSPNGLASWVSVAARVLTRRGHDRVTHLRVRAVGVRLDRPTQGQLDGDPVGPVRGMQVRVDPGALVVRTPARPPS
jgi:diacylglycerol kinase (ATP)